MSGVRNEARQAELAPPQHTADERDDSRDPTTLKFDGPVTVANEDAGSDPYNRTGRFQRFVRS